MDAKKIRMVNLYMQGKTDIEIAGEIGVTRETVNRWRQSDPEVIAEINKQVQAIRDNMRSRLVELANRSFDLLSKEIDNGNVQVALGVLKTLEKIGALDGVFGVGKTDPRDIESEQEIKEMTRF